MGNAAIAANTGARKLVFGLLDDDLEVPVEAGVDFDEVYVGVRFCLLLSN